MKKTKNLGFIIGSMSFYFGWLLSFPLYGPISYRMEMMVGGEPVSLVSVFILCHSLTYLAGGVFFRKLNNSHRLMKAGLALAGAMNLLLVFGLPQDFWIPLMGILGVASSLFVFGWGKHFSLSLDLTQKQRAMALIIILSNVSFVLINILSAHVDFRMLLAAGLLLLLLSALFTLHPKIHTIREKGEELVQRERPNGLLAVFGLFVFILNLNGGLLYNNIMPTLVGRVPALASYRFVPYMLALVILFALTGKYKLERLVFWGTALLGLSFVSYALVHDVGWGAVATSIMVESAFAMLDLFLWTTLGLMSFVYKMPYAFYGCVLAGNVSSIFFGGLLGEQIAPMENHAVFTAFMAAATIFFTLGIMPWVQDKIGKDLVRLETPANGAQAPKPDQVEGVMEFLLPGENLTPKETEILEEILSGMTNKEMAEVLFISINTLKTHLRHIYAKFGVSTKKQLLDMVENHRKRP